MSFVCKECMASWTGVTSSLINAANIHTFIQCAHTKINGYYTYMNTHKHTTKEETVAPPLLYHEDFLGQTAYSYFQVNSCPFAHLIYVS